MDAATMFDLVPTGERCPGCEGWILLSMDVGADAGVSCDCAVLGVLA